MAAILSRPRCVKVELKYPGTTTHICVGKHDHHWFNSAIIRTSPGIQLIWLQWKSTQNTNGLRRRCIWLQVVVGYFVSNQDVFLEITRRCLYIPFHN